MNNFDAPGIFILIRQTPSRKPTVVSSCIATSSHCTFLPRHSIALLRIEDLLVCASLHCHLHYSEQRACDLALCCHRLIVASLTTSIPYCSARPGSPGVPTTTASPTTTIMAEANRSIESILAALGKSLPSLLTVSVRFRRRPPGRVFVSNPPLTAHPQRLSSTATSHHLDSEPGPAPAAVPADPDPGCLSTHHASWSCTSCCLWRRSLFAASALC